MLWLVLAPLLVIVVGGGYFLFKAVVRVSAAMADVRQELANLGQMGPRLQSLADDVSQLSDTIEEKRRQ